MGDENFSEPDDVFPTNAHLQRLGGKHDQYNYGMETDTCTHIIFSF